MAAPGTFAALLERLQNLHIATEAGIAIEETKDGIMRRNREHLMEGFDSEGLRMRPYRWESYALEKNMMNPKPGLGNPDLFYTGDFQNRLDVQIVGDQVRIFSNDDKAEKLKNKYGDDIYGMTPEGGSDYIRRDFYPQLAYQIERKIKLRIGNASFKERAAASLRKPTK